MWDTYSSESLKHHIRKKRSVGISRRVTADTRIPSNWVKFLRCDENKSELFSFLTMHILRINTDKLVVSTDGQHALTNADLSPALQGLQPCNHEEADARIFLHILGAAAQHKKIMVRTVDTDVVVLAIAAVVKHEMEELWVAFGTAQHLRYILAHTIASFLGPSRSVSADIAQSHGV